MENLYINGELVKGTCFAYDGCHKIYICEDKEDEKKAKKLGYTITPLSLIKSYYETSCDLKFIHNWKLTKFYVEQNQDAIIEWR